MVVPLENQINNLISPMQSCKDVAYCWQTNVSPPQSIDPTHALLSSPSCPSRCHLLWQTPMLSRDRPAAAAAETTTTMRAPLSLFSSTPKPHLLFGRSLRMVVLSAQMPRCTEMSKILCTWLREVCSCCSLTVLPGPVRVLLIYVSQRILLISV